MNRAPRVQQLMNRLREQEFRREQIAAVWHTQPDLLLAFIEPFLKDETPSPMFENRAGIIHQVFPPTTRHALPICATIVPFAVPEAVNGTTVQQAV
jgi:hypothetical protein